MNLFTRQTLPTVKSKHLFMNILYIQPFWPQKRNAQEISALWWYNSQARSPFWPLKRSSEHAHALLLPRLSWSWTVVLPSDTHRKHLRQLQLFFFHLWPIYRLPRIQMTELVGPRPISYILRLIISYQVNKPRNILWGWRQTWLLLTARRYGFAFSFHWYNFSMKLIQMHCQSGSQTDRQTRYS
jgi:hypothetical protein